MELLADEKKFGVVRPLAKDPMLRIEREMEGIRRRKWGPGALDVGGSLSSPNSERVGEGGRDLNSVPIRGGRSLLGFDADWDSEVPPNLFKLTADSDLDLPWVGE